MGTEQNMVYCAVGLQMTAKSTITMLHQETALGSTRVMRGSCMSSHTQPYLWTISLLGAVRLRLIATLVSQETVRN